jgi:hypothetical protein
MKRPLCPKNAVNTLCEHVPRGYPGRADMHSKASKILARGQPKRPSRTACFPSSSRVKAVTPTVQLGDTEEAVSTSFGGTTAKKSLLSWRRTNQTDEGVSNHPPRRREQKSLMSSKRKGKQSSIDTAVDIASIGKKIDTWFRDFFGITEEEVLSQPDNRMALWGAAKPALLLPPNTSSRLTSRYAGPSRGDSAPRFSANNAAMSLSSNCSSLWGARPSNRHTMDAPGSCSAWVLDDPRSEATINPFSRCTDMTYYADIRPTSAAIPQLPSNSPTGQSSRITRGAAVRPGIPSSSTAMSLRPNSLIPLTGMQGLPPNTSLSSLSGIAGEEAWEPGQTRFFPGSFEATLTMHMCDPDHPCPYDIEDFPGTSGGWHEHSAPSPPPFDSLTEGFVESCLGHGWRSQYKVVKACERSWFSWQAFGG